MDLKQTIQYILNGEAVLFLGAGFSRQATNIIDTEMSDAQTFSDKLAEEMGLEEKDSLDVISDIYIQSAESDEDLIQRKQELIRIIQNLFYTKNITDEQKKISLLPWKRIYTTNYDDIVEFAHRFQIKSYNMKSSIKEILREKSIVHLNGYARNVTTEKIDNEFKLTTRSYLLTDFQKSPSKKAFDHDIKTAKAIIIIGASFKYDIDIQRLLYKFPNIKQKVIFIERKDKVITQVEKSKKNLIGEIFQVGMEGFVQEVEMEEQSYTKSDVDDKLLSFVELSTSFNAEYESLNEDKMWELLINGDLDERLLYLHKNEDKYLINRNWIKEINSDFESKDLKIGIIHSYLGNGKTVLAKQVAYELIEKYTVFEFTGYDYNWELELEKIAKIDGNVVILVDDYQNNLDFIFKVLDISDTNVRLLLTCRTSINLSVYHRLEERLHSSLKINEYDINVLYEEEIERFAKYIKDRNFSNVFGKTEQEIIKFIKSDCRSNLVNILIEIMKSREIREKVNSIINPIFGNEEQKELLFAIIINNTCQLGLKFDELITLLESQLNYTALIRDKNIQELVNFSENRILIKSSILAKYILSTNEVNIEMIKIIEKIAVNAYLINEHKCKNVREKLISLSNLRELIFQNRRQNSIQINRQILVLFDNLRDYEEFKGNIFFWLQYAMACIDTKSYLRADEYFNNSYNLAKKANNFNTYQIDTQYGRYLLSRCVDENKVENSFEVLKDVQALWLGAIRMKKERSDYVFKQFYLLKEFFRKFSQEWEEKDVKYVLSLLEHLDRVAVQTKSKNKHSTLTEIDICKKIVMKRALQLKL